MPAPDTASGLSRGPSSGAASPANPADGATQIAGVSPSSSPATAALADSPPIPAADDKTVISKRPLGPEALPPLLPSAEQIGQLLAGKRLEHYELDEFVGGGGMGAVFRATDTRLGRIVAVKVLLRDRADEETIRRFQNEAQNAARLDHPNIARVYYVGEDHGWNFIVFEFIQGTNLRDAVAESGPLTVEDALYYTLQIAEALAHSSSRDVVHRDIKPSNVLVTADNQVKLVDMGLARLHQVASSSDDLTASGVTLGTFDYISPEQARDPRSADVRSDIYSLGCTLHYMLTGQPPFPDGTALQKLIRHSSDEPPDIRAFRPEVPSQVASLLAKMLAKRPAQRHETAQALVAEIVSLAQELGLSRVATQSPLAIPGASRGAGAWERAWQAIAAVALLVTLLVLVDSFFASRGQVSDVRPPPKFSEAEAVVSAPQITPSDAASEAAGGVKTSAGGEATPTGKLTTDSAQPDLAAAATLPRGASGVGALNSALARTEAGAEISPPGGASGIGVEPSEAEVSASAEDVASSADVPALDKPERIFVVSAEPTNPDPKVEYATTLRDACRRAAALGLADVELRWNGRLMETPLEIVSQRLTLRAGTGFRPIVAFRPSVANRQMIRLLGGGSSRLSIQGVELRMELPIELADGWSLIAMGTGQSLELQDCVLTVQDGDADGPSVHDQVAMINVQSRRPSETMVTMEPQPMMSQSAAILLERSIARGEATFVAIADETPLTIRWNQGLLVTSQRLIETGGSASDPKWYEKIDINLTAVTAICREGLHQMRRGAGKGYQLPLDVVAERCIFSPGPATPLFEYVGAPAGSEDDLRLQSTGDSNCYPSADVVFLRVRSGVAGESEQNYELDDRRWSTENRSQVGNPFLRQPPLSIPAHALTKLDFVADPELSAGAGFDPLRLPDIAPGP